MFLNEENMDICFPSDGDRNRTGVCRYQGFNNPHTHEYKYQSTEIYFIVNLSKG